MFKIIKRCLYKGYKMKLIKLCKDILVEHKQTNEIKSGPKRIVIECNDAEGELEKFLQWWKSMGNIGHSAEVHCDVNGSDGITKIFCDGDGADRIYKLEVTMLEEKE